MVGRSTRHSACVRDVALGDGADLGRGDGNDVDGVAGEGEELDFVARAAAVDEDDGADIAGAEAVLREVAGEDGAVEFLQRGHSGSPTDDSRGADDAS